MNLLYIIWESNLRNQFHLIDLQLMYNAHTHNHDDDQYSKYYMAVLYPNIESLIIFQNDLGQQ